MQRKQVDVLQTGREALPLTMHITLWTSIIIIFVISIFEITGWIFNLEWATNMRPYGIMMRLNVAILFILIGVALLILFTKRPLQFRNYLPLAIGILVTLISLLIIGVYLFLRKNGYEEPITETQALNFFLSKSKRMAMLSAVIFFFIGIILILMSIDSPITSNIAHLILFPVGVACYLVPASYLLRVYSIHEFLGVPIALSTGITFCFVCVSLFLLRPDTWLMRIYSSNNTGGIMARKLVPWLVFLPLIIGWFRIKGEETGVYPSEVGVVLVAITYTSCFILLVWFTARSVNRIDEKKRLADEALKKSFDEMEMTVQRRTAELVTLNQKLDGEIKERIRAEEIAEFERQRLKELLEMLPAYLILLSPDYRVAYSNRFFRERFGDSRGGRCFEYLFNRTEPCEICETFKVLKTNKPLTWEWKGPDKRDYSIFDYPFTDSDGSPLIMEMGIDITDLKQAEANLNKANAELEVRIAERTAELVSLNEQLHKTQEIAHLGSWELDIENNILTWSDEVYRIFGIDPKTFTPTYEAFLQFIYPEDREKVDNAYLGSIREGKDTYEEEHRIIRSVSEEIIFVHEKCTHIRNPEGKIYKSVGMIQDITQRKLSEEALRESKATLMGIVNATTESIWLFNTEGVALMSNQTGLNRLKFPPEHIIGHSVYDFLSKDLANHRMKFFKEVIRTGSPVRFEDERDGIIFEHNFYPIKNPDNSITHIAIYSSDITKRKEFEESLNKSHLKLEGLVKERTAELMKTNELLTNEITERKKAESVLLLSQKQLRALTQRMDEIAEEERKNIAREIHDEMGHMLTVLKYDLDILLNSSDLSLTTLNSELKALINVVDALIDTVRKISTELRPGILDHLGLFPAIEWQIKQFQKRTKINCNIELTEADLVFDKNETIIIFRILQEALTNIARHSKATIMWVTAEKTEGNFRLKVTDNGIGFKTCNGNRTGSFGLMGMRERALSIGGEIQVESSPGKGTTITITLKKD